MRYTLGALILGATLGCGSAGDTPAAPSATSTIAAASTSASSGGAQVVIAFYDDASCSAAHQVGQRRYDTGAACFSWFAAGSNAQENSANHFQCWRDRLCYTQHPDSMQCAGALATDKEARTDRCVKEPAGRLYALVLSGTEDCPPAPPGFECPLSEAGQGTR